MLIWFAKKCNALFKKGGKDVSGQTYLSESALLRFVKASLGRFGQPNPKILITFRHRVIVKLCREPLITFVTDRLANPPAKLKSLKKKTMRKEEDCTAAILFYSSRYLNVIAQTLLYAYLLQRSLHYKAPKYRSLDTA